MENKVLIIRILDDKLLFQGQSEPTIRLLFHGVRCVQQDGHNNLVNHINHF